MAQTRGSVPGLAEVLVAADTQNLAAEAREQMPEELARFVAQGPGEDGASR